MKEVGRLFAWLLSAISHPLLVITYGLILIIAFNPFIFGVNRITDKMPLILISFAYTFLLPFISIVFMKLMGLIESLELKTKEERIGPLIICIVFYTWFYINVYRNADIPILVGIFSFGSVIALAISFLITIFTKISLHAVAWGGLMGLLINMLWHFGYRSLSIFNYEVHIRLILVTLVLISGFIASARLLLYAHNPKDIYSGFLVGFTSQLIAIRYLL